ncbi:MAG: hypothetical protein HOP15_15515 [Planctomycetes bacterium]|nr:hypothetical protein [Planctomycetota bacterium]
MKLPAPQTLWLLAALLFAGCSATGPIYAPPVLPLEGELGVVEIYRPDSFLAGGVGYRVYIDDQKVVTLWNNGYTRTLLPAGPHTLGIGVCSPPFYLAPVFASDLKFPVRARERTCLRIDPGLFTAYLSADTGNEIATAHFEKAERDRH